MIECRCWSVWLYSTPFSASACFLITAAGIALAILSKSDVDSGLALLGAGADEARLLTDYILVSVIVAAAVNCVALLMCCLASGRTREVLFGQPKFSIAGPSHLKSCLRCCVRWLPVRAVQSLLLLTFTCQLLLSCVSMAVGVVLLMLDAVCGTGSDAVQKMQDFVDILNDSTKDLNDSFKWARNFQVGRYCSGVGDLEQACFLLAGGCILTVFGQGPMLACLSWALQRVQHQLEDDATKSEASISLATAAQMDAQAKQLVELREQCAFQSKQEHLDKEKLLKLQEDHATELEDMYTEITRLRSLTEVRARSEDLAKRSKSREEDYEEELEEEEEQVDDSLASDGSGREDAAANADLDKYHPFADISQHEIDLQVQDPAVIPKHRGFTMEAKKAESGCMWCSTPCSGYK